ncbi:MAG: DUF4249 family protein [Ginsengibacter sp.]
MKKIIFAFSLCALFISFGCKKIIHVSLNNVPPQIVIVGAITDQPGPYTVTLSTTVNYTAENSFPAVSGAFVTITGNSLIDTLTETSPGNYTTHSLLGAPGNSYELNVVANGKTYNAISTMPQPVHLDSVGYETDAFSKKRINAIAYFQDPAGMPNYYQFIEFNNGVQFQNNRGVSVFSDRLSDGKYISHTLDDDSTDISVGNTVTIQMNSIDVNVYNYLYTQNLITRQNDFQSPTPNNPTGNISNKALGYFAAYTIQKKSVFIP